jgi:hypothetical protein
MCRRPPPAKDLTAFDLVVSDIIMAPGRWTSLARIIRERQPGPPVLLVAGYSHMVHEASTEFIVLPNRSSSPS